MAKALSPDWSDQENDVLVAAYFRMLAMDLRGESYNKAEVRRGLEARIGRSKGSLEFKNRNVSGVLSGMGQPWIDGYKPASKFQTPLVDAVMRWFAANPNWEAAAHRLGSDRARRALGESRRLSIDPPPTQRNTTPLIDLERLRMVARVFDAAERDHRNRSLGEAGEQRALLHEEITLRDAGRDDLARRIRWVSREDGDGAGYDIASFGVEGAPRLIEVKTTSGWERTPFHITRNEVTAAEAERNSWVLLRLWNFAREPRAFEIRPPLDRHVELTPTSFLASLR
jgi:hypothetical protein